jgi:AcrR family transcriptional regulator
MTAQRLTREERKSQTRERLLDAAAAVFATRGYHAASVDEIAARAGFSTGALYSNFAGKEDLFLELFERHVAERVRMLEAAVDSLPSAEARAHGAAESVMQWLREEPGMFLLFIEFWAYAVRDPELRPRFAARSGALREACARLLAQGAEDLGLELPLSADRLGTAVHALGTGIALERVADPDAVDDELFGAVLALLFAAARPRVAPVAS